MMLKLEIWNGYEKRHETHVNTRHIVTIEKHKLMGGESRVNCCRVILSTGAVIYPLMSVTQLLQAIDRSE